MLYSHVFPPPCLSFFNLCPIIFLEDWILFYSSWKRLKAADVFVLDFCEIKLLKRNKKGIKRSSEFFLKVLMGVSPFTDVYGSLWAFECL